MIKQLTLDELEAHFLNSEGDEWDRISSVETVEAGVDIAYETIHREGLSVAFNDVVAMVKKAAWLDV